MVTSGDSRGLTPKKTKLSVRMNVLLLAIALLLLLATVIVLASQQPLVKPDFVGNNKLCYVLLLLVGAIVSLVLLVFWVNWHENRRADAHLRQLVHHFVRLQIEERRGFARELHDGINQLLVAVRFRVELAQRQVAKGDERYRESLSVALETLDTTIKEVRQVSHCLRPALLDEMGLEVALESLVKQFQERTGIQVIRYWQMTPQALSEEVAIMVYRVVQEAFSNIERHAQATQVHLDVLQAQKQLLLTLWDDGNGFDLECLQAGRGLGLLHMREWVELLGGQFQLQSSPQQGTHISAQLPLGFRDGRA